MIKKRYSVNKVQAWFVIVQTILTLVIAAISAQYELGWKSAAVLAYGMYILLLVFAWFRSDQLLMRLVVIGTAAGFIELIADRWLVLSTQTLLYAPNEPMLVESPLYMPFAWAVIIAQIGYIGYLINSRLSLALTSICVAIFGGCMIPLHEHFAFKALWWQYKDVPMVFDTPYYIIAGEALICLLMPLLVRKALRNNYYISVGFGVLEGLWIWVSYFISFIILK